MEERPFWKIPMCYIKPVSQLVLTKALKVVEQVQIFIFFVYYLCLLYYCHLVFSEQYMLTLYRTAKSHFNPFPLEFVDSTTMNM